MAFSLNAALTLVFCSNAVFVLVYGMIGVAGNAVLTTAVLTVPLIALAWDRVEAFRPSPTDWVFLAFVGLIALSMVVNGRTTSNREYALLAISLAGYPAFRFVNHNFHRRTFIRLLGLIVAVGTLATLWAFYRGVWSATQPIIFGFGDAATQFLLCLGFLTLALVSINLSWHKAIVICGLIFIPCVVFASAMVRHPFIALVLALGALACVAGRYRQLAAIICTIIVAIAIGLATHPTKAKIMVGQLVEKTNAGVIDCVTSTQNTTAIRVALAEQAIKRIEVLAPVGHGVGSFAEASCLKTYPHNILLQAADELGMIGVALSLALVALAFRNVLPLVRFDPVARFVFAGLVFIAFESLVSGSLTSATLLFALVGWSAGLTREMEKPS